MLLSSKKKNQVKLLILISIFIFPLLVAQYLYYFGNMPRAQTNQGVLINNPHNISEFNLTPVPIAGSDPWKDNRWRIIYIVPKQCQKKCSSVLYRLQQVHVALGKNTNRLQRVNIHTGDYAKSMNEWTSLYSKYPHMTMTAYNNVYNDNILNDALDQCTIYVADPLGNIILSYNTKDANFDNFDSKIFKDVKKLLNISKIG